MTRPRVPPVTDGGSGRSVKSGGRKWKGGGKKVKNEVMEDTRREEGTRGKETKGQQVEKYRCRGN